MKSDFSEKGVGEFGRRVEDAGGRYLGHVFVKHEGRPKEEILDEAAENLEKALAEWGIE